MGRGDGALIVRVVPVVPVAIVTDTVNADDLSDGDERELTALVASIFPDEPSLRGRWYHDTRPTFVIRARAPADGALVGMRVVTARDVDVATGDPPRTTLRTLRLAGFGIGVAPAWQRKGVGTILTSEAIRLCEEKGFDVALAFLFSPNAERLLTQSGFRALRARVSYADRTSAARVDEKAPAFARDIARTGGVALIEGAGALHLGVGTW